MIWKPALLLALVVSVCVGCCPKRPQVKMVVTQRACVLSPPPTADLQPSDLEGPPSCPEAYEFCMKAAGAGRLERHLRAVRRWSTDTWLACKPEETNDEQPD